MEKKEFTIEEIKNILDLRQEYLRGRCEENLSWSDEYLSWIWFCLKEIAEAFWLDANNYWTTFDDNND